MQYLQMALSILINLIYTPIMLNILGQSEYGIYNLASSIIAYLNLLSLGLGASYIRFYTRYKKEDDQKGIEKLNGLYLAAFLVIGLIALVSGLVLSFNVSIFFNDTYTLDDLRIAKILMIFLSVNLAVSFPASVFTAFITSQEKFIFQKLVNIGKTVIGPLFSIVALFMGFGSIGMVIITTAISLCIDLINLIYCISKLKMRFSFGKFDFSLFKEIMLFSIFIAINQIIDQINWQTDKIILGKMINSTAVSIYAVSATINTLYLSFSTAVSFVFTPTVHRIVNENQPDANQKLTDLMIKVGRIQLFIISLILTGFIFFGKYFINKWAGADYALSYYVVLILICPVTIPLLQNLGIEIQRAKNMHKFRSVAYLIMALINVVISIILCRIWGVIGVAVGTAISLIVCNVFIMNFYYHKKVGINVLKFWKEILKGLPAFIIPGFFGILLMNFYTFKNLIDFVLLICVYVLIYGISVFVLGLNKSEKKAVLKPFKKREMKKDD